MVSNGRPPNSSCKLADEGVVHGFDRDFAVGDAEGLCHFTRIFQADADGEFGRHHHRMHAVRTQRINRHRERQRRVYAARHAQYRAGEAVLADIIPDPQLERFIHLRHFVRQRRDLAGLNRAMLDREIKHAFLPGRKLVGQFTPFVHDKGGAVEYQFILSADLVAIDQRHTRLRNAVARNLIAFLLLDPVIGRRVGHQQHPGARAGSDFRRAAFPDVAADVHAKPHSLHVKHAAGIAGFEGSQFIEHGMVGKFLLVVHSQHLAVAQHGRGVVAASALQPGITHDHRDAVGLGGQLLDGLFADPAEILAQHQVFGRIAANAHLRGEQQTCPGGLRLVHAALDQGGIARHVSNRGVDLGQGDFHWPRFRAMASTMASPIPAGLLATTTPAFSSAAILASAVPVPPAMIAPAWPMRLPLGAVRPAM